MLSNLKSGATETGSKSVVLLDAVSVAYTARDWATLRTLYHDESRLCTVAAHGRVVGPDELMTIFEELTRTPYSLGPASAVAIDDHAAIVTAPLPLPSGARRDRARREDVAADVQGWARLPVDGVRFASRCSRRLRRARYFPRSMTGGTPPPPVACLGCDATRVTNDSCDSPGST